MTLTQYLTNVRERIAKATPGEWNARESADAKRVPYLFISPGYFLWPQFIENKVTKMLNVKPNEANDVKLIANAPQDLTILCTALELAVEALERIKHVPPGIEMCAENKLAEIALTKIESLAEGK